MIYLFFKKKKKITDRNRDGIYMKPFIFEKGKTPT